jgi:5-(carboxyamino)imidazole ribonucleotide mutase
MPTGVPVATVAINGAKNAGLLACQILGTEDPNIAKKIQEYKQDLESAVLKKADAFERIDFREYVKFLKK